MLILIEFNELCPSLVQQFSEQGLLPNFQRFYESSTIFTTDACEEPPNLEPWIQWPTVHSGMSFADHGIFHLGDGRKLNQKCVAEVLSDADVPVGVLGSMNLNYRRLNGYLIPDPWDKEGAAYPEWMQVFYRTVSRQVQESSGDGAGSKAELLKFGLFLLRHGLTLGSVRMIVRQLWQERRDPGVKWRRASLLDHLQYDLFRALNRRFGVHFATFFCNSTAHYQHYYWRNMQPERFAVPPPATDHPSLRGAIVYGYQMMDRLLGRFLADYPNGTLMLCTALSQRPWVETTKCTYRPHHFEDLLEFAGVSPSLASVKPVMAEEFHLDCPTEDAASLTETRLVGLTVDGEPAMKVERNGKSLFAGCRLIDADVVERSITRSPDSATRRFGDLFHMVHTMRSGRHDTDGILWVRNGQHRVIGDRVPLTDIAPTILAHFRVAQPPYMQGQPLEGCTAGMPAVSAGAE
jgi:hypothetical protein